MKMNLFPKVALLCAAGFAVNAFALEATNTLKVVFKVEKTCKVVSTAQLDLDVRDSDSSAQALGVGSVTVNCSKKIPYTIGLLPSNGATDGKGTMKGKNVLPMTGNNETIAYTLFTDVGRGDAWGTTGSLPGGTGTAQDTSYPVYGKVTGSVNVAPDEYEDDVKVTVTY